MQASQGPVRAPLEVAVDEVKALCNPNGHVKAVGKDEAHTATPSGQEIRQHEKGGRQCQHGQIVPGDEQGRTCVFNSTAAISTHRSPLSPQNSKWFLI